MRTWNRMGLRGALVLAGLLLACGLGAVWSRAEAAPEKSKMLRHIVLLKFKAEATPEQVEHIAAEFAKLPEKIPAIAAFEWGLDNSPEKHSKGFTHCFLVTFKDEKGREEYLPHEAHQAFVQQLLPVLEEVLVVDYWAGT